MLYGFNAFGDDFYFQLVSQQDDQLDHVGGSAVSQHSADQGAVDFQGFHGEETQSA